MYSGQNCISFFFFFCLANAKWLGYLQSTTKYRSLSLPLRLLNQSWIVMQPKLKFAWLFLTHNWKLLEKLWCSIFVIFDQVLKSNEMKFSHLCCRLLSGPSIPALQERCIITTVKQRSHSGRNQRNGLNGSRLDYLKQYCIN